ncbi:hypothetical protein [Diaminobutyricimonas sp. TR449]|nr:hypothetical protein [Diaminobutyricimonas sp. TR449]
MSDREDRALAERRAWREHVWQGLAPKLRERLDATEQHPNATP